MEVVLGNLNIMHKYMLSSLFVVMNSITSFGVSAQSLPGLSYGAEFTAGYDDNFLKTSASDQADSYFVLTPNLNIGKSFGKHLVGLTYSGSYTAFSENDNFNFAQHEFGFDLNFDLSKSLDLNFATSYEKSVEKPGDNDSTASAELLEFTNLNVISAKTDLSYGTTQSKGQLVFSAEVSETEFSNNEQSFRDVRSSFFSGVFYYRLSSKLRAIAQLDVRNITYLDEDISVDLSSLGANLLGGLEWRVSAKTSGSLRLGYEKKQYDSEQLVDISGLSYYLSLNWSASSFTNVALNASRNPIESAQAGVTGYFRNNYNFKVRHALNQRVLLLAGASYFKYDINEIDRSDERTNFNIGIDYAFSRLLSASISYQYSKRQSNVTLFSFDSNILELSFSSVFE